MPKGYWLATYKQLEI